MNFDFIGRVCRLAALGAILLGSASCVKVNEELGGNFIPVDQRWNVVTPDAVALENIQLHAADSLSAYSSSRFSIGSINSPLFGKSINSTSFTLVPILDSIDFGTNIRINQFHLTAVSNSVSAYDESQKNIIQNIFVSELKMPLDTNTLYGGTFMIETNREKYLDTKNLITDGIPTYDGGDSLSFDFSPEFTAGFIERIKGLKMPIDSMNLYLKAVPGIYITTDAPENVGGRVNVFDLELETSENYISGNYAELKITADYGDRKDVDTSFLFMLGATNPMKMDEKGNIEYPSQFAFNTSNHDTSIDFIQSWENGDKKKLYVEGGFGLKPVVKAREIKEIVTKMMTEAGVRNFKEVVVNKASLIFPYEMPEDYLEMDKFPTVLTPTVRLRSEDGGYITYAGLSDSSIASEDQGDINRSTCTYSPDISHHVQQIINLEDNSKIDNYDIWMLIMHDEVIEEESSSSSSMYDDYYNSLLYSSYYNNMMYGGYGGYGGYGMGGYGYGMGGYGYGMGGYGYDMYGYGYDNYYNYMMMAAMSSSYSTSETSERILDKERYYNGVLNGPGADGAKPSLKIVFSVPMAAEK